MNKLRKVGGRRSLGNGICGSFRIEAELIEHEIDRVGGLFRTLLGKRVFEAAVLTPNGLYDRSAKTLQNVNIHDGALRVGRSSG